MTSSSPLPSHDTWDDAVRARYHPSRATDDFRQHDDSAPPVVREFYRVNHAGQTREFVRRKKAEYGTLDRRRMGIWEALEALNTLVDDSDPDTDLSQIAHNLQTAEAARRDGRPDWFVLTGLVHDLGKLLCLWGEPQWAVVGDTFPVGCAWDPSVVYPVYFEANPDRLAPEFQTRLGVYREGCGLDNVDLSWGYDEYMFLVAKPYLPQEAQAIIRYHSFYSWHQDGAYDYLCNDKDRRLLPRVREFQEYDLYSKADAPVDPAALRHYYEELIAKHFPPLVNW